MRRFAVLAGLSLAFFLGCGGASGAGGSPPPPPVVTLSVNPATLTLTLGATQAFTATVTGTSNTAVIWSVV